MSLLTPDEKAQIRINAALDMIEGAASPQDVQFAAAYAVGYAAALRDERRISIDGAQLYTGDAYTRRQDRLAALGANLEAE